MFFKRKACNVSWVVSVDLQPGRFGPSVKCTAWEGGNRRRPDISVNSQPQSTHFKYQGTTYFVILILLIYIKRPLQSLQIGRRKCGSCQLVHEPALPETALHRRSFARQCNAGRVRITLPDHLNVSGADGWRCSKNRHSCLFQYLVFLLIIAVMVTQQTLLFSFVLLFKVCTDFTIPYLTLPYHTLFRTLGAVPRYGKSFGMVR